MMNTQPDRRVHLTKERLDPREVERLVLSDQYGAVTTFCGRVRDHNEGHGVLSILYEAYEEMTVKVMREIVDETHRHFPSILVAVHHRIGELKIGDAAVVVSVASAHRKVTFEACAWVIDELKARAPIFKHERREGGEVWVGLGP